MNALGRGGSEREEGELGHRVELIKRDALCFEGSLLNPWLRAWRAVVFGRLFLPTD